MTPSISIKILKAFFIILLVSFSLYFFTDNKVDPDLWGHLKFGQDIFEKHHILKYDIYSYSSPGARWINHEWLSELAFYTVFTLAGGTGLLALKFLVGLAVAFLIYITVSGDTKSFFLKLLFLMLPLSVISYGFATRPQIFTYLFFAALVFLIDRFKRTGQSKWLYPLPAVFFIWCNMHGGFVAGLAVLAAYCLASFHDQREMKSLAFFALLSLAVTLINPNGAALWTFMLRTLSGPRPYLPEWGRVTLSTYYIDYFVCLFAAFMGIAFSKIKRNTCEIAILSGAVLVSFLQNRHIVLFAILFSMYVPKYMDSFAGDFFLAREKKLRDMFYAAVLLCISLVFSAGALYAGKTDPARIEIPREKYPVNAVYFMKENGINGNIFCFFDWAEYCIWELSPSSKVFFDGRYRTVYSEDLIEGYFAVLYGGKDYADFLNRYPETDIMLLHTYNPLAMKLSQDRKWILVYASPVAKLFLRVDSKNKDVTKRFVSGELEYKKLNGPFYLEK
ncbi:MAG: hypothetical protein WBD24_02570 [Candidatus Omnitrophota bacterium]